MAVMYIIENMQVISIIVDNFDSMDNNIRFETISALAESFEVVKVPTTSGNNQHNNQNNVSPLLP